MKPATKEIIVNAMEKITIFVAGLLVGAMAMDYVNMLQFIARCT